MAVSTRQSPVKLFVDPANTRAVNDALSKLGRTAARRVVRAATSKVARKAAKLVKAAVGGRGGEFKDSHKLLQKSIGFKLYTNKTTGRIGAVIGPRRRKGAYVYTYRRSDRGKLMTGRIRATKSDLSDPSKATMKDLTSFMGRNIVGKPVWRNPTRYAHIIEKGSSHSPAHPYMRPTWDANVSGFRRDMRTETWKGLRKEAAKLAKKTARFRRRRAR